MEMFWWKGTHWPASCPLGLHRRECGNLCSKWLFVKRHQRGSIGPGILHTPVPKGTQRAHSSLCISGDETSGRGFAPSDDFRNQVTAASCHHCPLVSLRIGKLLCTSSQCMKPVGVPFVPVSPGLGRPVTATL